MKKKEVIGIIIAVVVIIAVLVGLVIYKKNRWRLPEMRLIKVKAK